MSSDSNYSQVTSPSQSRGQIGKERYGAGDTYLVHDVLPPVELEGAFERLLEEVQWCTMSHRGGEVPRLVSVQGIVDTDGTIPVYRHPADDSPPLHAFTPTVSLIRDRVAQFLPEGHPPLNHVLIQLYRSGKDYISEHSDKTIDILRGSSIINVSLGAQRRMTLRTKKNRMSEDSQQHEQGQSITSGTTTNSNLPTPTDRSVQHIPLLHNSAFIMGLDTNRTWLHGIRADRRPPSFLTPSETAFDRERISLTFRSIGTFLSPVVTTPGHQESNTAQEKPSKWLIWGQGARGKTRSAARPISSHPNQSDGLIRGFGKENHSSNFDWDRAYGKGFDVVNFPV